LVRGCFFFFKVLRHVSFGVLGLVYGFEMAANKQHLLFSFSSFSFPFFFSCLSKFLGFSFGTLVDFSFLGFASYFF
jgi:hypothetical protein